ncbi:MAG TPA: ATP-binding protein [Vicinamibacterales bacterium]|nr:ATP-binding protein [Vicinamibacterales bacterium]
MSSPPSLTTLARALVFAGGASTAQSLASALETLCVDAAALLDVRRASIWLHDRRARELALTASSDPGQPSQRVPAEGLSAQARGMRLEGPQVLRADAGRVLVAPLRGWRRALGTFVLEGLDGATVGEGRLLELAAELAQPLSAAIENVQLLEEVVRQQRLLEDTFNSLADLVVVTDRAMRIVQVNTVVTARIGKPRAELVERPLAEAFGPEMTAWAAGLDASGEAPSDTTARTRTFEDPTLGGTFAATVTPLINEDGEPVGRVLVARDITRQKRLEAEREALRTRLAQSEKLVALGQFVAGIAHEMNNPLQGVLGHLELLIDTSQKARPIRSDLRLIYQEARRAAKIVRNLLVFTGSQRIARRRLRIDRVIARALASRRASLKRSGIEVVLRSGVDLPAVLADPLLIQQAFLNVLVNAEHAIAETGRPGRIQITSTAGPAGSTVIVSVQDSGPGIPEDVLPRIFDPFFTTKDVGKGTGLGLAITYGIVQEHGGAIQAANAPEGGAIVTIELPAPPKSDRVRRDG